ncbi:MAG: hypothetical protein Q7J27_00370 [Syntrophales bacterium]|nr:hypothetical protein [Syntrophales bacterium]
MKKSRKKHIEPGGGDVGGNSLYVEVDEGPESDFFVLTQNSEVGKKIIEQTKGEVKVDKSIDFFLRDFPLSDDDKD